MDLQPMLTDNAVRAQPLQAAHFERLYAAASDPLVWAQHPTPTRYQRPVFETYFRGALESRGALLIARVDGEVVGSSRYYEFGVEPDSVMIGYTFFACSCWGTGVNQQVKRLMLDHAFAHVGRVRFQVGAENRRSQIAMERLGAKKMKEVEVAYFGEAPKLNYEYAILRDNWLLPERTAKQPRA